MLETAASHGSYWQMGRERRECIFVKKRNWNLRGSPDIPLLKCGETLLLIRAIIYVFWGPYVAWRMWFLKFQMSYAVFQSFVISADIHLNPYIFDLSDLR